MAKSKDNKTKIQTVINRDDVRCSANIEENYIFTTEDKIKILYEDYNKARKSSGDFWTSFSVFITLIVTLVTCDFKDLPVIDSSVLKAIFIIASFLSLLSCICNAFGWYNNRKKLSFSYFIDRIRGVKDYD